MENRENHEYPGGWKLADDIRMQYVRRYGPRAYQLIECGPVAQDVPLYEVYAGNISLCDYEDCEIEAILRGFGYDSISALYQQYPCRDEANQVIARCIFERKGGCSTVSLCNAVSEFSAQKVIHEYLLLHYSVPESQNVVEVSAGEFVCRMLNLRVEETLDFFEYAANGIYSVVKVKHFNRKMLLINHYGGCSPIAIALSGDMDSDKLKTHVLECFEAYCEANGIHRIHISLEPQMGALCPEAQNIRDRKKNALFSKDALMKKLSKGGYTDRALSEICDEYMDALGFDPVWRYPFCHDGGLGAVLIPVKEGFLWLPYSIMDIEDNERYEPENAALLDSKACEWLIEIMRRFVEPLTAVMRYVADELKETERLTMG